MRDTLAKETIDHFRALIKFKKKMLRLKEYPKISTKKDIQTLERAIRILELEGVNK